MARKKWGGLFLGALLLFGNAAGMEITLTDMKTNQLKITGTATSGDLVTAMILRPDAANAEDTDKAVYLRAVRALNGAYAFQVVMPENMKPSDGGGKYTFVVQSGDNEKETKTQNFYYYSEKENYARKLSSETVDETLTKKAFEVFSLEQYLPYTQVGAEKTAAKLSAVIADCGGFVKGNTVDVQGAYDMLTFAATAAALENNCSSSIQKGGTLAYGDTLGFSGNKLYTEYLNNLSTKGVDAVQESMAKANILSPEDGNKAFEKAVLLQMIKNYKDDGSGHVGTYFSTEPYKTLYTAYGFDLLLLNQVKDVTAVYTKLCNNGATTIEALATAFPQIIADVKNSGGGGGTAGGGRPASGTSVGGNAAIGDVDYISPAITDRFSDLDSVPWAQEAIRELADKGVISGKGNGLFAPNDEVTRQEFVKMLVGAFALQSENAICSFDDVSADWAKQSVAVAAALNIVNGMNAETFAPEAKITREDGAVMLARTAAVIGTALKEDNVQFADDTQIADYAKTGVYGLSGAGVISGKGNNMFDPKATMTRAEAVKMIYGLSSMR